MSEDVRASVFHDMDGCVKEDCNHIFIYIFIKKELTSLLYKIVIFFTRSCTKNGM